MIRVLIIEEQLRDERSHHLQYLQAIVGDVDEFHLCPVVLCNERASAAILRALACRPVLADLTKRGTAGLGAIKSRWARGFTLVRNVCINASRVAAEARNRGPYDLVLCLTAWVPHMVCLIAAAVMSRGAIKRIGFLFVEYPRHGMRPSLEVRLIAILAKICCNFCPQTLMLAETAYAQEAWQNVLGIPVRYVPHPVIDSNQPDVAVCQRRGKVIFGVYGFARYEQGSDTLLKSLHLLADDEKKAAEFHVLWPQGFTLPDGSWFDKKEFPELEKFVHFYDTPFSSLDYIERLRQTDWLILPYRPKSYAGRCSRIAVEACVLGVPVIYTKGTDLEEVIAKHGAGIAVNADDPQALTAAIKSAVSETQSFQKNASAAKAAAKEIYSSRGFWTSMGFS